MHSAESREHELRAEPDQSIDALVHQFISWIGERPRTREEVAEAWQSACPRLTIFEDAMAEGYVRFENHGRVLALTDSGRALVDELPALRPRDHESRP